MERPGNLRRQKECCDRIGTKRISDTDRDCRSDSSRPHLLTARTRVCHQYARTKGVECLTANRRRRTPVVESFGTARRIRNLVRKPLGLNPYAGRSCPDPGRLSTFGVSGLCPCRRLTYRGTCGFMVTLEPAKRQPPRAGLIRRVRSLSSPLVAGGHSDHQSDVRVAAVCRSPGRRPIIGSVGRSVPFKFGARLD
jgi:hypothetical protein